MAISALATATVSTDWRQLLEDLYRGRNVSTIQSSQFIAMQPHEVLIVCRGLVQLSTLYPNGDEGILGLVGPSMPFGIPFSLLNPYEAIALTDVVLMRVHIVEIEQSPRLAQSLFRELMRRLQQTETLLAIAGYRRVDDRLRQLLELLRQEIGQVTPEGTRLSVRLTHQQLAGLIGTTRVTVTRLLREFRDEGSIGVDAARHICFPASSSHPLVNPV
ncbi:Crp/Fnr family transcriptional regulator [Altericista sp. CCNU0014]|uniref:Crp/Fnr family transcriptional regulator n=1 Tax=Altericista sp. CCNU0014 TaxID=3082949 RepID=UPI00384DD675